MFNQLAISNPLYGIANWTLREQDKSVITTAEQCLGKPQNTRFLTTEQIKLFWSTLRTLQGLVDCVWNVMAHAKKPDFVFRRNGRVHLNWPVGVSSVDYCTAKACASAVVMLDTPCSEVVWRVLATHLFRQFPLHFPSLRRRMPSHFNWSLL